MTRHLLLFDVDATLLKTGNAGLRAMAAAAAHLFGEAFTWEGVVASGHLDPLIFAEAAAINGLDDDPHHHQAFHDHYLQKLPEELEHSKDQILVLPGVLSLLDALRQRSQQRADVVLGLLTGNYTKAVPIKLGAAGLDPTWFDITAFGDEGKSRPDLVELAMRKYAKRFGEPIESKRVIVIGDTPRDVNCAKAHNCVSVAVATGRYSTEQLREAGADVVLDDLSDAGALLAMLPS